MDKRKGVWAQNPFAVVFIREALLRYIEKGVPI
jgi:hypothetical protein